MRDTEKHKQVSMPGHVAETSEHEICLISIGPRNSCC